MLARIEKYMTWKKAGSLFAFLVTPVVLALYKGIAEPYVEQLKDPVSAFLSAKTITNGFVLVAILSLITVLVVMAADRLSTIRDLRARELLIKEAQALDDESRRDRNVDFVTGIYNNRAFDADLQKKINAHKLDKPTSVLMIDFNGFGQLNRTFGFEAGDVVIRTIAQVINGSIRRNEFMYRKKAEFRPSAEMYRRHTGGDEFLFLLQGDERQALFFLRRLKQEVVPACEALAKSALNEIFKGSRQSEISALRLGFAAGVAPLLSEDKIEEVIDRVDACFWSAKDGNMGVSVVWRSLFEQWEKIRSDMIADGLAPHTFAEFLSKSEWYSKTHPSLILRFHEYLKSFRDFNLFWDYFIIPR